MRAWRQIRHLGSFGGTHAWTLRSARNDRPVRGTRRSSRGFPVPRGSLFIIRLRAGKASPHCNKGAQRAEPGREMGLLLRGSCSDTPMDASRVGYLCIGNIYPDVPMGFGARCGYDCLVAITREDKIPPPPASYTHWIRDTRYESESPAKRHLSI